MAGINEAAQVDKKQDRMEAIFNVQVTETPFVSMLTSGAKPKGMKFDWPVETYPDDETTGELDGTDVNSFGSVARELIDGVCMWQRQPWMVTKLANLTETAGAGRKEKAKQAAIAMIRLKRKMERQACSTSDLAVETGGTPWTTRGAFSWMNPSAQAVLPVPANYRPGAANVITTTLAGVTEETFGAMMNAAYTQKRSEVSWDGVVGIDLKLLFDLWTARDTAASASAYPVRAWAQRMKTVENVVDVLTFSSGTCRLHKSTYLANDVATGAATEYTPRSGLFLEMDMWKKRYLQAVESRELPDLGGGPRGLCDVVWGLVCLNPLGQGYILVNADS